MSIPAIFRPAAALLLLATLFVACDSETATEAINEEEAFTVIENAMSLESAGTTEQTATIAEVGRFIPNQTWLCGITADTVINRSRNAGLVTYDYTFTWNWEIKCPNGSPTQLEGLYTMHGIYDTPRMSSDDTASHSYILDNVNTTDTFFVFNGTYQRDGSQTSKIRQQHTFTSQLTINNTNVHIAKSDRHIISGTGTFTLQAQSTSGNSRSLSGNIVYNGDGTATVSLANGATRVITLRS